MTREQFLLMKLAEECAEVAQRAIKSMQYGSDQVWKAGEVPGGRAVVPDEGLNNAQRLMNEILDLGVMIDLLQEIKAVPEFPEEYDYAEKKKAKVEKLNKYLAFSRSLGIINGDWTV